MRTFLHTVALILLAASAQGVQFLGEVNAVSPHYFQQTFSPQQHFHSAGIVPSYQQQEELTHRAVVESSIAESQLPAELLNPFYKNPAIVSALAKESWFGKNEFPIRHREADKISRQEIYKIISRLQ